MLKVFLNKNKQRYNLFCCVHNLHPIMGPTKRTKYKPTGNLCIKGTCDKITKKTEKHLPKIIYLLKTIYREWSTPKQNYWFSPAGTGKMNFKYIPAREAQFASETRHCATLVSHVP